MFDCASEAGSGGEPVIRVPGRDEDEDEDDSSADRIKLEDFLGVSERPFIQVLGSSSEEESDESDENDVIDKGADSDVSIADVTSSDAESDDSGRQSISEA